MPPKASRKMIGQTFDKDGSIKNMEFVDQVRGIGNSCHILLPKELEGKRIRVRLSILSGSA